MRFKRSGGVALAVVVALGIFSAAAIAAEDAPKATDLIFESKHLEDLSAGDEIKYNFERVPTDPKILGTGFTDTITLKVDADKEEGKKDLNLQIYTGERARDPQVLEKFSINPVFAVFFSQAVSTFNQLAGGQVNYLQRAFTEGWLKAKVEPIKLTYNGKEISGYHISMTPYVGDKYEAKMQGWESAKYDVIVSDEVPGDIVDMRAGYHNRYPPATLKLTERITLDGITGLEGVQ